MAAMAMGMMVQDRLDDIKTQSEKSIQTSDSRRVDAFRNMFAILHNLTPRELAGITKSNTWPPPCLSTFVLKLDDARLDALYALVQSRQPERYRDSSPATQVAEES